VAGLVLAVAQKVAVQFWGSGPVCFCQGVSACCQMHEKCVAVAVCIPQPTNQTTHRDKVTVGSRLGELLDGLLEPLAEDRLSPQEAIDVVTGGRLLRGQNRGSIWAAER
jgi:hypothetical protein